VDDEVTSSQVGSTSAASRGAQDGPSQLSAVSLRKAFGALVAVNDVSFEVRPGQIFGIAGPNGSGKSTLFNLLTGIPFGPDKGEVHFDGRDVSGLPAYKIARAGIVRSFQKDATFESLSARQTVEVAASYGRQAGWREAGDGAEGLLDLMEFPVRRRDESSGSLPIFDKKRLALASGLATKPRLLLLDEPASGLTKPEVQSLASLIRTVRGSGVTVMLVEHVLPLLLSVSDTLLVMHHGSVIARGLPDVVFRDPVVVEAYLGRRAPAQ
jgi:branched-chain amino acid transport system ATP-binding protein